MNNTTRAYIDYETYSEYDLEKVGAVKYAKHPFTGIICVSVHYKNKTRTWDMKGPAPSWFKNILYDKDIQLVAHNALFEIATTTWVLPKYMTTPVVGLSRWVCTASKAAACALPRNMEDAAIALKLPVQKSMDGRSLVLKYCKPRQAWFKWRDKNDPSLEEPKKYFDDEIDLLSIMAYCETDVEVTKLLDERLPELLPKERKLWLLNIRSNIRGVRVDIKTVDKVLSTMEKVNAYYLKKFEALTGIDRPTKRAKFLKWLDDNNCPLPNTQKKTIEDTLQVGGLPREVKQALKITTLVGKTSISKYTAFKKRANANGRVCDISLWHGASTGRNSGTGIQPHNFPRGSVKDTYEGIDDIHTLSVKDIIKKHGTYQNLASSCLRSIIMASPNHTMGAADFNAIECRVVNWLADNKVVLEGFKKGKDVYKVMASYIFSKPVEGITEDERFLGKQAQLAAGYGMGAVKFQATCEAFGHPIPDHLAQKAVQTYRQVNFKVPALWKAVEMAAKKAMEYRGQVVSVSKVKYYYKGDFLWCVLPSGRKLAYHSPKIKTEFDKWGQMKAVLSYNTIDSVTKKWVRRSNWGGGLVENISQAVARDVIAEGMLRCHKKGFKYLFDVHDELIVEWPGNTPLTLDIFVKTLVEPPKWAKGLPIKAGGWSGPRYKKGKETVTY